MHTKQVGQRKHDPFRVQQARKADQGKDAALIKFILHYYLKNKQFC